MLKSGRPTCLICEKTSSPDEAAADTSRSASEDRSRCCEAAAAQRSAASRHSRRSRNLKNRYLNQIFFFSKMTFKMKEEMRG